MRRSNFAMILAASLLSVIACTPEQDAGASYYKVNVLGCYLPIPSHYILNTRNSVGYFFYDPTGDGIGEIYIREYDEEGLQELLDVSDVLGLEEAGDRVAMLISVHLDGAPPEGIQTAILHDFDKIITINGDHAPNWRPLFSACIASPSP